MALIHTISEAVWRDIRDLYAKDLTAGQIAKLTGQNEDTVRIALSYPTYPKHPNTQKRYVSVELSWEDYVRQRQESNLEGIARGRAARREEQEARRAVIRANVKERFGRGVERTPAEIKASMTFLAEHS